MALVEVKVPDIGDFKDVAVIELLVKPGDKVKAGDVVGKVGSTGRSTGPHLHYEVRRDGAPLNPIKFIKAGRTIAGLL